MTEYLSILLVDDEDKDLQLLTDTINKLEDNGITLNLESATTLKGATRLLDEQSFDIIILNLYLQDSQGIDSFLEVQKRADAPVILIGRDTEESATVRDAIKLGAQDYLPKTDVNCTVLSRIIHHSIERHRLQESLKALSFSDELTGVYNRRGFITFLEQQMALTRRLKRGFYLFIIDLDYLKQINDTYGHLTGDRALTNTAKCLRSAFRKHDIVGRIGGDEFAILAINASYESGDYLRQHMLNTLKEYNQNLQEPYRLSFSIGRAYFYGNEELSLDDLLQAADNDLYNAKRLTHKNSQR